VIEVLMIIFGIPFLFAGGAALLLDWRWPEMTARRQRAIAALASALGGFGWAVWVIADANAHPSGSPDLEGYIALGAMLFAMIGVVIGFIASRLMVRYLRGE
jgi:uncharacterized protein YacL